MLIKVERERPIDKLIIFGMNGNYHVMWDVGGEKKVLIAFGGLIRCSDYRHTHTKIFLRFYKNLADSLIKLNDDD